MLQVFFNLFYYISVKLHKSILQTADRRKKASATYPWPPASPAYLPADAGPAMAGTTCFQNIYSSSPGLLPLLQPALSLSSFRAFRAALVAASRDEQSFRSSICTLMLASAQAERIWLMEVARAVVYCSTDGNDVLAGNINHGACFNVDGLGISSRTESPHGIPAPLG